jgi:hypothetical protein
MQSFAGDMLIYLMLIYLILGAGPRLRMQLWTFARHPLSETSRSSERDCFQGSARPRNLTVATDITPTPIDRFSTSFGLDYASGAEANREHRRSIS